MLQIHIFMAATATAATAAGLDGVDMQALVLSLTLSLLCLTKSWLENSLSMKRRGYLERAGGSCW